MTETEEKNLLQKARKGDKNAFALLCETHKARLWRVVSSVTRCASDTEDLAQEAIIKAYCALHTYREEASFGAWLCRIAVNAAHDYRKSAWKRRVFFWEQDSDADYHATTDSPHTDTERREVQQKVRQAVARLHERERVPIWLVYFEEFSVAEVARLENIPESTLRSRIKAGLARLAGELNDLEMPHPDRERESTTTPYGAVQEARCNL